MITLSIEYSTGETHEADEVEGSSWQSIERAIRHLGEGSCTSIILTLEDYANFSVSGGNGCYLVYYDTCNSPTRKDEVLVLTDPQKVSGEKVALNIGGQISHFSAEEIVDLDLALKATWIFFKTRKPDPELAWQER